MSVEPGAVAAAVWDGGLGTTAGGAGFDATDGDAGALTIVGAVYFPVFVVSAGSEIMIAPG